MSTLDEPNYPAPRGWIYEAVLNILVGLWWTVMAGGAVSAFCAAFKYAPHVSFYVMCAVAWVICLWIIGKATR